MLCRVLPLLKTLHLPLTCKVHHWLPEFVAETLCKILKVRIPMLPAREGLGFKGKGNCPRCQCTHCKLCDMIVTTANARIWSRWHLQNMLFSVHDLCTSRAQGYPGGIDDDDDDDVF